MDKQRQKINVAMLSVLSNTTLVCLKLFVGILIGSVAVISEAIHSLIDLLASAVALFAVRTSGQPADEGHSFGHGKFESLSGTIEALLIFVAAIWIIYESAHKLMHPSPILTVGWGVGVMLVSSLINAIVARRLFSVGKQTDSLALQADGMHLLTDVYTSLGVMTGLGLYLLGTIFFPSYSWSWLDPVSAIAVALLIVHAAYRLTMQSVRDLLDSTLPQQEADCIRDIIAGFSQHIAGFHNLRSRKSGPDRFVEAHVMLDPAMTVARAHELNDRIVNAIRDQFPGTKVMLHLEPCLYDCSSKCKETCLQPERNLSPQ